MPTSSRPILFFRSGLTKKGILLQTLPGLFKKENRIHLKRKVKTTFDSFPSCLPFSKKLRRI